MPESRWPRRCFLAQRQPVELGAASSRPFQIDAQLKRNLPRALVCSLIMAAALRGGAWLLRGRLPPTCGEGRGALGSRRQRLALFLALALRAAPSPRGTQADAAARLRLAP